MHAPAAVSSRPPGPLDDALRSELVRLRQEVELACPPYRASRRDVRLPAQSPLALRWYWEIYGYSVLSQRYAAPDDPAARETALGTLADWCQRDVRYEELRARVAADYDVIAFDDDELVLLSKARGRIEDDPPLVALRAPTGAAEAPDLEPAAVSVLRYLVAGVLRGLWSELARVLLTARPPLELEQPFPRVALHVGRAEVAGVPVWVAERPVRDRPGFAVYCRTHEVEALDAWLIERGLGDEMLV